MSTVVENIWGFVTGETVGAILKSLGLVLTFFAAAAFLLFMLKRFFPRLYKLVISWKGTKIRSFVFRKRQIISEESSLSIILTVLQGIRFVITLIIVYTAIIFSVNAVPWTQEYDLHSLLNSIISSLFILLIARFIAKAIFSFHVFAVERIRSWKGTRIQSVSISNVELVSGERIASILLAVNSAFRILLSVFLIYATLASIFSLFEFTKEWSATLLLYLLTPFFQAIKTLVGYLPNLFTIIVILFLTRYAIKFVHLMFSEIEKGNLSLLGFYSEWADPTYKIVRFLIIVFSVVIMFPYLPGSGSDAFKGISVFLGILFSFGSSSAISNVVSGIVLTYMRPFKIGDRVKIADTIGDVVEKTLLVTRVRTIKNVDITVPNSMVLGSHIINFSAQAKGKGLILHTTVTIGYDAPWQKVHSLLIAAAQRTEHILKEPAPFVLQTALNDFYVSYELNASTDSPNLMAQIYSDLHQHIQDSFNEAGVEIMSPHYGAVRDGNQTAIPDNYLPKEYTAPGFKIFPWGDKK